MTKAIPAGARESSAGDEFHVLWAVRRVLALLDPSSGLERVVMEDLTPDPTEGIDPELLLAADMTEFYGGTGLTSASRVVVSQLKYSHRHPQRTWTAARLAQRGGHGQEGVIRRLADLYSAVAVSGSRDEVVARLQIRLVSNMPCGHGLRSALAAAQNWLAAHPGPTRRGDLFAAVSQTARRELERLSDASNLGSRSFTDFLRVLDLSHTGTDGLAEQDLRITAALSEHVFDDLRHASLALSDLVRRRALPAGAGKVIERADVLAALEVHSDLDLLPAPARFTQPAQRIPTPDARRIVAALNEAPDRRVLGHGAAGVGKTTTVLTLERELPPGSVVITYDCFGDGDYETPGAGRHDPQRFGLQLCNDLAVRCRLPVLIRPPNSIHDLWRELARRLDAAAGVLEEQGARLVLVVDAADNSAWAGRRFGEDTFLRRLWAQPLPNAAGLVVTCRSGRRDDVEPPPGLTQVELFGFDEPASATYLRTRFPHALDTEAQAFHERSRGNPRVQFYVLFQNRADAAAEVTEAVDQANVTPRDIFESLLSAAVAHSPTPDKASEHLAELVCLTKPLTSEQFRTVSGLAAARVRAFCESLVPGVVIDEGVIAFRDEDFANFLREKVGPSEEVAAHGRLADLFLGESDDAYAAAVVADHLHNAGRGDDLVAIALEGPPEAIDDGLTRQQTYRRRLTLALRHAADVADRAAACRLVILAGEAARQNQAVSEILRRRPDLGMRYSDPEAVMRVYATAEQPDWQGPIHMQLAALYARAGDTERARAEGRQAQAWLVRRQEEDEDWHIDADDVGAYAEAWFHVRGVDDAEAQVRAWRPKGFAVEAGVALVRRLALTVPAHELGVLIVGRELPVPVRARLLAAAFGAGAPAASTEVRTVVKALLAEPPELGDRDGWWAASFAELSAFVGLGAKQILALTHALALPQQRWAPQRFERLGRYRDVLRLAALRAACEEKAVEIENLMPVSITDPPDESFRRSSDVKSERRAMHENVGRYIGVFSSRARALLVRPPVSELRNEWEQKIAGELAEQYRHEPDYGHRIWLAALADALLACEGEDTQLITDAAATATAVAGDGDYICWMTLARRLTRDPRYRDIGLRLLDDAASEAEEAEWPASQQADVLLEACAIADRVDEQQARDLHERAIRAAEGMDDEGIGRLELHAHVLARLETSPIAPSLAWRTAEVLVAHRRRVSDDEHLPWRRTLEAAAHIHPQTALALTGRWEDDCHMFLHSTVGIVAAGVTKAGFLTPAEALALLPLMGERTGAVDVATALLAQMAAGPERNAALAELSVRIQRDLMPDARARAAESLRKWASENGVVETESMRALAPFVAMPQETAPTQSRRWVTSSSERERREEAADAILGRASRGDPLRVADDLRGLAELYGSWRIGAYLERVVAAVIPAKRGELIDALSALGTDHPIANHHADDLLAAVMGAADAWRRSPSLRAPLASAITRVLETHFEAMTRYAGEAEQVLTKVLALDVLDDPGGLVLNVIGTSLERLSPRALFGTAAELALQLEPDERAELLGWSLAGLEAEPVAVPELPTARADVVASLMWSLFAAPDKAIRWRAAHVARRLIRAGDSELARALFQLTRTHDGGAFASDRLPFYWPSAQVWTLMTIARVARDAPDVVADLAGELATVARDSAWPHVGVREFARRGALRIVDAKPGALSRELCDELRLANAPLACQRERDDRFYRTGSGKRDYDTERFHFDSMDTLPYVYGPFGQRFGLDVDEICDRAERWIVDRLGFSDTDRLDPRLELLDYSLRDNHHGSSPRGESWREALEHHALQLVAGELCDEGAAIEAEKGDDPRDPWAEWIERYTDALEYSWLVDERDPVPPTPTLLLQDVGRADWPELTEAEPLRAIGIADPDGLIVDASIELSPGFGWGSTHVSSALVSPTTAPALLRAVASMDEPAQFVLPEERGYWRYEQADIDHGEFRLQGWLWEEDERSEGLEEHDPLARISLRLARPGSFFLAIMRATVEHGGRRIRGPDGELIAWQRAWSDLAQLEGRRSQPRGSKGFETHVRRSALCEFLRRTNSMLILKASASRHRSGRDYGEEEETSEQRIDRVYLFDTEGRLTTVDGPVQAR